VKAQHIDVSDFVYCRSPYHRAKLGIPKDAGLVLEAKRSNFRTPYGAASFYWLPEEALVRAEGEVNTATPAGRLHCVIKRLKALDCQLTSGSKV
jgi:hypothetical protein